MKKFTLKRTLLSVSIAAALLSMVATDMKSAYAASADESLGLSNMTRRNTQRIAVQQAIIALASESSDLDGDGYIESPAMLAAGSAPSGGGGIIPLSSAAPKTDSYGVNLGYCAFDNGSTNSSTGRISGIASGYSAPVLAVVSSGTDNVYQTSCADVASGAGAQGDDYLISYSSTQVQMGVGSSLYYGDPVADVAALSSLNASSLKDGQIRLVKSTNSLHRWNSGSSSWQPLSSGGSLSSLSAATSSNSIDNNNNDQSWRWSLASDKTGMAFVESSASTGGTSGQKIVSIETLAGSTATPLTVSSRGVEAFRVSATAPQILAAQGTVAAPSYAFAASPTTGMYLPAVGSFAVSESGQRIIYASTSEKNFAFGTNALANSANRQDNVAIGFNAGQNIWGTRNIAVGNGALSSNGGAGGNDNVVIGHDAGTELWADGSVAVGKGTMRKTNGFNNVAVGLQALESANLINLYSNTAIGAFAMQNSGSTTGNVAVGVSALKTVVGSGNAGVGQDVFPNLVDGSDNVAMGTNAGMSVVSGSRNVLIGVSSQVQNTLGMQGSGKITLIGSSTLAGGLGTANQDAYMTAIGAEAVVASPNTIVLGRSSDSTVIGTAYNNGSSNKLQVTGGAEIVSGNFKMTNGQIQAQGGSESFPGVAVGDIYTGMFSTGSGSTLAVGMSAGTYRVLKLAGNSVSVGMGATTRINASTAVGAYALNAVTDTGSNNSALGFNVLSAATDGRYNTAAGSSSAQLITTGSNNTSVGAHSLSRTTTGSYNTAIGYGAQGANDANTNASNYITLLGANATATSQAAGDVYMTAIGAGAEVTSTNTVVLGRALDKVVIGGSSASAAGAALQVTGGIHAISGNVLTIGGTKSLPGYGIGDTTTGMYLDATSGPSILGLSIAGTSVFKIQDESVALGSGALPVTGFSSSGSTAVGTSSLFSTTTGDYNSALGYNALYFLTTGSENTAVGRGALTTVATGNRNSSLGGYANQATTGSNNVAVGYNAGSNNPTTHPTNYNTFIGTSARGQLGSGSGDTYMTAIGGLSLVTTANTIVLGRTTDTTVIGATGATTAAAKLQVTGGILNVGVGTAPTGSEGMLYYNNSLKNYQYHDGTGWKNMSSPAMSQIKDATANNTIANGAFAQNWNWRLTGNTSAFTIGETTASTGGTAGGQKLLSISTLADSTATPFSVSTRGVEAMRIDSVNAQLQVSAGTANIPGLSFINAPKTGFYGGENFLGASVQTGPTLFASALYVGMLNGNTALGSYAHRNGGGNYNTAMGFQALPDNMSGEWNVALGAQAMYSSISGSRNVAIGDTALGASSSGSDNIAIGSLALADLTSGTHNTALGKSALAGLDEGQYNTAVGSGTYLDISSGGMANSGNITLIGANSFATGLTTADANAYMTAVGAGAGVSTINTVVLGRPTDNIAIGQSSSGPQQFYVNGTAGGTSAYAVSSDVRFKKNILELKSAMDTLKQLKGVSYDFNQSAFPERKFESGRQLGFIAQQIEQYVPEIVRTDAMGYKSVQYSQLVPLIVEGLKEHNSVLQHFSKKDDVTMSINIATIEGNDARFKRLESEEIKVKNLEAQNAKIAKLQAEEIEAKKIDSKFIRSDVVKTGETEAYIGAGAFQPMFTPNAGTQYIVNATSEDGSVAFASVSVMGGRIVVTPMSAKGIDILAVGDKVGFAAANKFVKATWIRMS